MDFDGLKAAARSRLTPQAWDYYQGVADGQPDRELDHDAWQRLAVIPRVLRGVTDIDTSLTLGGAALSTPIMVSATAAHGLADSDAEISTAAAAAGVGALMVYSNSATVEVRDFAAATTGPWWAQVYVMQDRRLSDDYLARIASAGPAAVVLTVDSMGALGEAPFRSPSTPLEVRPANYPELTWREMSSMIEPGLLPQDIGRVAAATGLPVYVKGILHPADAVVAIQAGAAGVVVSNHGRRQVAGVVSTAAVLAEVVAAVAGRVPVLVDGGIRSGIDVLRALAIGATAVGVGRPVLWALAAGGSGGVAGVLEQLTAELRQAMAAVGAPALDRLEPGMVRWL